jgi:8-oxo-dGTP pyrophosphatase MutT (NUDIX family)
VRGAIPLGYFLDLRAKVGPQPLIAVGADVIVLDAERRVLLQQRKDDGRWSTPGGSMEPGESFEQTAQRELFEETGLRAEWLELITVCAGPDFFHTYPNGDEIYNAVAIFLGHNTTGTLRFSPVESINIQYFAVDALPDMPPTIRHMLNASLPLISRRQPSSRLGL